METHFQTFDLYFLAAGFALALLAIIFFVRGKIKLALLTLLCAALTFRLLAALIDPFLHPWDEQYHALVASNLANDPLHPVLYKDPALPYDPANWTGNHTWLHKPPLFLWQMALSIKLFGLTPLAIRLPSVLLSVLMVAAVFRMGKLLHNERTGFLAALLLALSNMQINVVSGFLNTDQNDVVFSAYVLLSFWAWTEYAFAAKRKWIVLTGVLAGAAILVKWLPGLLVFGGWGLALLLQREWRRDKKRWLHFLSALLVTAMVALPWKIYSALRWPLESKAVSEHFLKHVTEDLGHPGPWWFHFEQLAWQFGMVFALLLPAAFYIFYKKANHPALRIAYPACIIFVFAFYSFVSTRMPLFCFIVSPLLILMNAVLLETLLQQTARLKKAFAATLTFLVLLFISWNFFDIGRLEHFHTQREYWIGRERSCGMFNRVVAEKLKHKLPENTVVFNCGPNNPPSFMFFSGLTAYDFIPDSSTVARVKALHRPVAVFEHDLLPEFLKRDKEVMKLRPGLMSVK